MGEEEEEGVGSDAVARGGIVRWLVIVYPDLTRGSPRARKQDKVGTSMLQRGSRGGRLLGEVGPTLP